MAIRSSMTEIVAQLRQYGQAAPDDVFDGITYWTDEQLQKIADQNARRGLIKMEQVSPDATMWKLVAPKSIMFENSLVVYNSSEVVVPTAVTFNGDTQELTFTEALSDDTYMVYGFAVDINDALAQLWQAKADQRFNYVDWKAQNNKMNMAQEYQHCVDRAMYYRNKKLRTFDRQGRGKWFY